MATMNNPTGSDLDRDPNVAPLSSPPGSHPVATGVGAVAGGLATGAAAGTVAGPVGTLVGAAVGAIVGGLAGKAVGEQIDPAAEDTYWRDKFASRPYVPGNSSYDDYGPAYRYGVDTYQARRGSAFEDVESDLARDWDSARGSSSLTWDQARHASRDSWQRLSDATERAVPGDSDRDGK